MQFAALNTSIKRGSGGKNKKKEGSRRFYTMHTQLVAVRGSQRVRVGLQSQYFFSSFSSKCVGEKEEEVLSLYTQEEVCRPNVFWAGLPLGLIQAVWHCSA